MKTNVAARRAGAILIAASMAAGGLLLAGTSANAVATAVPLLTAGNYAVLGSSTVTNTGPTVVNGLDVGVSPGTSVTGFPPGIVNAPGAIHSGDSAATQARTDLTAAYSFAAAEAVDSTLATDLSGLVLGPGVYDTTNQGAISLTGTVTLDAGNDPNAVFVFKSSSTLMTGSGSNVALINGATECNIFWQVGSSATLGTGSLFRGNILALTSVTVTTGVTVHGRALALNGAVTLDSDTFDSPTCGSGGTTTSSTSTTIAPTTTSTTIAPTTTSTTIAPTTTSTTIAPTTTTTTTAPEQGPTTTTSTTIAPTTTTTTTAPEQGPTTTTSTTIAPTTTTTAPEQGPTTTTSTTTTSTPATTTTTSAPAAAPTTTTPGSDTVFATPGIDTAVAAPGGETTTTLPTVAAAPRTGGAPLRRDAFPWLTLAVAAMFGVGGTAGAVVSRRSSIDEPAAGR